MSNDKMLEAPCLRTSSSPSRTARHRLETVSRACVLLKAFADDREVLTLADLAVRTGFEKTIAFRLVHTLEEQGLLRKTRDNCYCSNIRVLAKTRLRIGYAQQSPISSFSNAVSDSIRWAAERSLIDLIVLDNHYSAKAAVRNAERLIVEKVDLAIEFQTYEKVAPIISSLFRNASIPLIAVEIPHPGATFFGIDNYRVGLEAGRVLGRAAKQVWADGADDLLLFELEIAGSLPHLRLAGVEASLREALPRIGRVQHLNTRGEFLRSLETVRRYLRASPGSKRRTLIAGVNDSAVLGALRAFEEAGCAELCLAVGLGGTPEARNELRFANTRLIGSVAFFPERYGESLIQLAQDILHNRSAPSAVYAPYKLITPQTVSKFYPNDGGGNS